MIPGFLDILGTFLGHSWGILGTFLLRGNDNILLRSSTTLRPNAFGSVLLNIGKTAANLDYQLHHDNGHNGLLLGISSIVLQTLSTNHI